MYDKESYLRNKECHRKSWEKRQKRNFDYATQIKLERGCYICGYKTCQTGLDFHHTSDDKVRNVSRLCTQGHSLEKVKAEIEKCVVLCRNCHAEVHEGLIAI